MNHLLKAGLSCLWAASLAGLAVCWAEQRCSERYERALTLLQATERQALTGQHPRTERFASEFRQALIPLKETPCQPEMKKLSEYIRSERRKYPLPTPIED